MSTIDSTKVVVELFCYKLFFNVDYEFVYLDRDRQVITGLKASLLKPVTL